MKTSIMYCLAGLLLCLLNPIVSAQTVFKGTVSDEAGQGIEGVVVKLSSEGRMLSYALTRTGGNFEVMVSSSRSQLEISFEHLSYKKEVREIQNRTQTLNVTLTESTNLLREVTVSVPRITTREDTLSYRLSAFVGNGDTTLEDAMKKLPGISVGESGGIKFQGREISKFYIEGMDLVSGRYTLATKNITAENVEDVQVINNHKEAKMDKDRYSDDVAINIKLKEKAKLKPIGTSEASLGYGDKWLYRFGSTGMIFTPSYQSIITAKTGNDQEFALDEITDLVSRYLGTDSPQAISAMGNLTGSTPPLSKNRFIHNTDHMASVNTMKKLSEDASLKANVNYGFNHTSYNYVTKTHYFMGDDVLTIDEQISPHSRTHKPSLDLEYRLNSEDKYLNDKLSFQAHFTERSLKTVQNGADLDQRYSSHWLDVNNDFSWRLRLGTRTWNLSSTLKYTAAPSVKLLVNDVAGKYNAFQTANSNTFHTIESMSTTYRLRSGTVYLPLSLSYYYDDLQTELGADLNKVYGHRAELAFSPRWEYTTSDRRINLHAQLSVRGLMLHARNKVDRAKNQLSKLYLNPTLNLNYSLNAYSSLHWDNILSHSVGDVLNLLTAPIQQTYRIQSIQSGVLSQGRVLSSSFRYEFKQPISLWFINARLNYVNSKRNLLASQNITADDIDLSRIVSDNTSHNVTSSLSVTKTITPIHTKISLEGSISWSRNQLMQQQILMRYDGRILSFTPSLNARPWQWIELDYQSSFAKTTTKYKEIANAYTSQSHRIKLSLFPMRKLEVFGTFNAVRQQLAANTYKRMTLFDIGAEYRLRSVKLSLQLNNILNQHHYAYTIFTGIDSYTYDYRLRGRELSLSLLLTK